MSDYHARMTSIGTKRGIRSYWIRWRKGREKGQKCKFHNICLEDAKGKRRLYEICYGCHDCEGSVRAYIRPKNFEEFVAGMKRDGSNDAAESWLEAERELKTKMNKLLKQTP